MVKHIARHTGPLGLPVQPDTQRAVVDAIVPDDGIHCRVELDAADLIAEVLVLGRDAIDVIVFDQRERRAHVTHDAILAAVVDLVVAHDVAADLLPAPTGLQTEEHAFHLILIARLAVKAAVQVMAGGCFLAQADGRALGIMQVVVLDDPPLGPVHAQHADLICRGRREGTGCLAHLKATDGDVVPADLLGVEATGTHVDLHQLRIGIRALEVGIQHRRIFAHLGIPLIDGILQVIDRLRLCLAAKLVAGETHRRYSHLLHRPRLVHGLSVQVHIAQMHRVLPGAHQPVALDSLFKGVPVAEHGVVQRDLPDSALQQRPASDDFAALDDHMLAGHSLVGDALGAAQAAFLWIDPFAVHAFADAHRIAGQRRLGSAVDRPEGGLYRTGGAVTAVG